MDGSVHVFWILSRATGIAAILICGLTMTAGLLAGRGLPFRLPKRFDPKAVHESLSVATISLVAIHGLLLLGDPWLKPGLAGISVPFVMEYRSFWTGLGILSGYGLALLGLSYYLRSRIGPNRWRLVHRFIAVFWILGLVHTFGAGTDATRIWLWVPVLLTSGPALALLLMRLVGGRSSTSAPRPVMMNRH
jgi:sulfoxide reductase heme-binding subunit YedZ